MTDQYLELKLKELEKRIETLEQKPKAGHWIRVGTMIHECPFCRIRKDSELEWNYCPNCGAKMEGEDDK